MLPSREVNNVIHLRIWNLLTLQKKPCQIDIQSNLSYSNFFNSETSVIRIRIDFLEKAWLFRKKSNFEVFLNRIFIFIIRIVTFNASIIQSVADD